MLVRYLRGDAMKTKNPRVIKPIDSKETIAFLGELYATTGSSESRLLALDEILISAGYRCPDCGGVGEHVFDCTEEGA